MTWVKLLPSSGLETDATLQITECAGALLLDQLPVLLHKGLFSPLTEEYFEG